jgi:hypothetical protein
VARFAWFLFELITKSMLLSLKKSGLLGTLSADERAYTMRHVSLPPPHPGDDSRRKYFAPDFVDELNKLVHSTMRGIRNRDPWCAPVVADLNTSVGLFLKDLLSVMDRGAVLGMVLYLFPRAALSSCTVVSV